MRYLILKLDYRALSNGRLPGFKGSTIRGAFGRSLKQVTCVRRNLANCSRCDYSSECLFYKVYETEDNTNPGGIPRPYIFRSYDLKKEFEIGQQLSFEMIIFEKLFSDLNIFRIAAENAGNVGFGAGRTRFKLENFKIVFPKTSDAPENIEINRLVFPEIFPPKLKENDEMVKCYFEILTPLSFKLKKEAKFPIHPPSLFKSFLRRLAGLSHYWGHNEWATFDFTSYWKLLDKSELLSLKLTESSIERYSSTQRKKIPLHGFVGDFSVTNVPVSMLKLLIHLENIHVGKGSSWGMGLVRNIGVF